MNLHNSSGVNECFYFFFGLSNLFTISVTALCVASSEELETTGRVSKLLTNNWFGKIKKSCYRSFLLF